MNAKTRVWGLLLFLGSASAGYWTSEWLRDRAEREKLCHLIGWGISEGYLLIDTNRLYAESATHDDTAADDPMDEPAYTNAVDGSGLVQD
jgi:hypothetical protein